MIQVAEMKIDELIPADYNPRRKLKPAPTILKSVRGDHGAGLLHPDHNRLLGINEVKALFSFPPEFMFFGKFEEQWGRIGNCVPPLLMKAIAEHLKTEILEKAKS